MNILNRIMKLPLWTHAVLAGITIIAFNWIKGELDKSYAASNHPVDYATGQTSFDAEVIKSWYNQMLEMGTLDIYHFTQIIDYGFIVSIACMGLFVCTLVARASREGSLGRRIGLYAGLFALIGALCDAIENGWSFVMLANPTGFANWLAIAYSSFATVKFILIAMAMLALIISIVLCITAKLLKRPVLG